MNKPLLFLAIGLLIAIPSFVHSAERGPFGRAVTSTTVRPGAQRGLLAVPKISISEAVPTGSISEKLRIALSCPAGEEDCDREDCNTFYRAVKFFNAFYQNNPSVPRVVTGDIFLSGGDMVNGIDCLGYPRDAFDMGGAWKGPFAKMSARCRNDKDGNLAEMPKEPQCPNFAADEYWERMKLTIYYNPADITGLNNFLASNPNIIAQGQGVQFDPNLHVPVCVEVGLDLSSWANACAVNCCTE